MARNQSLQQGYDFSSYQQTRSFSFGPRSSSALALELSLAGLFDCLTLECSSTLVHPQWKHFRHMGMQRSDRIRLNNGIWRSWHLQYLKGKTTKFVCFSTPNLIEFETNHRLNPHNRPKTIVMEGKYWRRNQMAVAKEYRKWRLYYKEKWKKERLGSAMEAMRARLEAEESTSDSVRLGKHVHMQPYSVPGLSFDDEEMIVSEDVLFGSAFSGGLDDIHVMETADVIQPRLDQLNPMFDDFFSSIDMVVEGLPQFMRAGSQSSCNLAKPGSFQFHGSSRPDLHLLPVETLPQHHNIVTDPIHSEVAPLVQQAIPASIGVQQSCESHIVYHQDTEMGTGNRVGTSGYMHNKQASVYGGDVQHPMMQVEVDSATAAARQFVDEVTGASGLSQLADSGSSRLVSPVEQNRPHSLVRPYSAGSSSSSPSQQFEQTAASVHPQPSRTSSVPTIVNRSSRRRKSRSSISSSPTRSAEPYPQQKQPQVAAVPQMLQRSRTDPSLSLQTSGSNLSEISASLQASRVNISPRASFAQLPRSLSGDVSERSRLVQTQSGYSQSSRKSYPGIAPKIESDSRAASGPSCAHNMLPMNEMVQLALQSAQPQSIPVLASGSMSTNNPSVPLYGTTGMNISPHTHSTPSQSSISSSNLNDLIQQLVTAVTEAPELLPKILEVVNSYKKGQQGHAPSQAAGYPSQHADARSLSSMASQHHPYTIPLQEADIQIPQGKHLSARMEGNLQPQQEAQAQVLPGEERVFFPGVSLRERPSVENPPRLSAHTPRMSAHRQSMSPPSALQRVSTSSTPTAARSSGEFDFQSKMMLLAVQQTGLDGYTSNQRFESVTTAAGPQVFEGSQSQFTTISVPFVVGASSHSNHVTPSHPKDHRRQSHITAEQKRRGNIKLGFEHLHQLLPNTCGQPLNKISKANMLQKATEYVLQLRREKRSMEEEVTRLQREIESLNETINLCQEQLPASGVPVSRQRFTQMQQMFQQYVREQTARNFKFWIFSVIIRPLFESFNSSVSTRNLEELCQTVLTWLEQKCALPNLRPSVLESLRDLSTTTSILSDPTSISKAAAEVVGEPSLGLLNQRPL